MRLLLGRGPTGPRLHILTVLAAAFLLVPAAQALAAPEGHIVIEGGSGTVTGSGATAGNPAIKCRWNGAEVVEFEPGVPSVCDTELIPNGAFYYLKVKHEVGEFVEWIVEPEGAIFGCLASAPECAVRTSGGDVTIKSVFESTAEPQPLVIEVEGEGEVTGAGIACTAAENGTAECEEEFAEGSEPELTATHETGWEFTGWTTVEGDAGSCEGETTPCEAGPLTAPTKLKATFVEEPEPRVHVIIMGDGSGEVIGSGNFNGNPPIACVYDGETETQSGVCDTEPKTVFAVTAMKFKEIAAPGSEFVGWEIVKGFESNPGTSCAPVTKEECGPIELQEEEIIIKATFHAIPTKELTVEAEGPGNVTGPGIDCGTGGTECSAQIEEGTTATLTAEADEHAEFVEWEGCDAPSGDECEMTMSADKSVKAVFAYITHNLTVEVSGEGSVEALEPPSPTSGSIVGCEAAGGASCEAEYVEGESVTLVATPEAEWTVEGWSGCDSSSGDECEVTVNADATVQVTLAEVHEGPLSVVKNGGGEGTVKGGSEAKPNTIDCGATCTEEYEVGETVTLHQEATEPGSAFAGWVGCTQTSPTECEVELASGGSQVTAIFVAIPVITGEPEGANCVEGGVKIEYNGETFYACNGEEGLEGPEGLEGDEGPEGKEGAPGAPGSNGSNGAQGPKGEQGDSGPQGPQGPQGKQGPAGKVKVTCKAKGKRFKCTVKYVHSNKRHHKGNRLRWRLMQGGHTVRHGATSVRRLQRSLNNAPSGRYVLRIAGQGGRRIHLG